jgi:hypothetical protein
MLKAFTKIIVLIAACGTSLCFQNCAPAKFASAGESTNASSTVPIQNPPETPQPYIELKMNCPIALRPGEHMTVFVPGKHNAVTFSNSDLKIRVLLKDTMYVPTIPSQVEYRRQIQFSPDSSVMNIARQPAPDLVDQHFSLAKFLIGDRQTPLFAADFLIDYENRQILSFYDSSGRAVPLNMVTVDTCDLNLQ